MRASWPEAAKLIEKAGFTFYDDVVHGFRRRLSPADHRLADARQGAGARSGAARHDARRPAQRDQTTDQKAGVQTGDVAITATGAESLHTAPRGPFRVGG